MNNDNYVPQAKIDLIHQILNDEVVGPLYRKWQDTTHWRERAFQEYAKARDERFGLPPIKIVPVQDQGVNNETRED